MDEQVRITEIRTNAHILHVSAVYIIISHLLLASKADGEEEESGGV